MSIRLGNLSLEEIQKEAGVTFPKIFVDFMQDKRQQDISTPIAKDKWHCFHLPFELVVGEELLDAVKTHLVPLGKDFKKALQVSVPNKKSEEK
jgi:hypothetical protein